MVGGPSEEHPQGFASEEPPDIITWRHSQDNDAESDGDSSPGDQTDDEQADGIGPFPDLTDETRGSSDDIFQAGSSSPDPTKGSDNADIAPKDAWDDSPRNEPKRQLKSALSSSSLRRKEPQQEDGEPNLEAKTSISAAARLFNQLPSLQKGPSLGKTASFASGPPSFRELKAKVGTGSRNDQDLNATPGRRMVERQATQQRILGSILNLVCEGDETDSNVELLRARIADEAPDRDPVTGFREYTHPRDEAGASLLHLAVLNRKDVFAKCFIEEFGEPLVNAQYACDNGSPGLYDGETALHIAIVNRSHKMVRRLLSSGADMTLRAVGEFFRPAEYGGICYYGELPIMFAVSTGQQSMVKILMAAGASLSELDSFHNTAQHFAVIHALPRMYSYVSEMLGTDWKPQKNVQGLSPMTLAVNLNKVHMFQHICAVQQRVVWNFGPVTCFDIPLKEFDTVDWKEHKSVLAIATEMGHTDILQHPFVEKLLRWKWNRFAAFHYYLASWTYAGLMVALSLLVSLKRTNSSGAVFGHAVMGCRLSYPEETEDYMSCPDYAHDLGEEQVPLFAGPSALIWAFEAIVLVGALGFAGLDLWDTFCFLFQRWQQYSLSVKETGGLESALSNQTRGFSPACSSFSSFSQPCSPKPSPPSPTRAFDANISDPTSLTNVPLAFELSGDERKAGRSLGGFLEFLAPRRMFLTKRKVANGRRGDTPAVGNMVMHLILWAFATLILWHFILFATNWTPWEGYPPNFELALAVICGYLYLLNFASGIRGVGHLIVMIGVMLKTDFAEFLIVYIIIALGFSQALYLIMVDEFTSNNSGLPECEYCSISSAATTFVRFTLGDLDFSPFRFHKHQAIVTMMYLTFSVISHVLLVNMLIAMMGNTFSEIYDEAESIWAHQRAHHILLVERRLSKGRRMKHRLGTRQPDGNYSFVYQAEADIPEDMGEEEEDDFEPQMTESTMAGGATEQIKRHQRRKKKFKAAARLAGMFEANLRNDPGGAAGLNKSSTGRRVRRSSPTAPDSGALNASMFRKIVTEDSALRRRSSNSSASSDDDDQANLGVSLLHAALPPSTFGSSEAQIYSRRPSKRIGPRSS